MRYWHADIGGGGFDKSRVVLRPDTMSRFDYDRNTWVEDRDLVAGAFIGSPEVRPITEQRAREVIVGHGGTWVPREG